MGILIVIINGKARYLVNSQIEECMRNFILLVVLLLTSCVSTQQNKMMLTNTSIGDMPIGVGKEISLADIKQYFPLYTVSHKIASGDSPDYHLYVLSSQEGEVLVSFISYINQPDGYKNSRVKLDEIIVHSSKIQDQFGVTPNMAINQALAKRNNVKFGAGHTNNYLGNDKIWYMFSVNQLHGTQVTKAIAVAANPNIESITWPNPRWN